LAKTRPPRRLRKRRICRTSRLCSIKKNRSFALRSGRAAAAWNGDRWWAFRPTVAREARAADLVIVGNARASQDSFRALGPGSFILKAGRPVLVVPAGVTALPPRRVAVACKDVREARRAVQDALPFLREAENVLIVEVSERGGDQALSRLRDVANYLARYRIATVTERMLPVDATAANSLLRFIADENISLVAAGGCGHSRLGEWAYGGVTRDLLAESPICCLFSH
jgi:nucleotide-binding universal stress UspA family protein